MENLEIGSSILESVPPPCSSVMIVPEDSDSDMEVDYAGLELVGDVDPDLILKIRRNGRENRADSFRREYTFGSSWEKKTCIWSGGGFSCRDYSSGIMWVGVHGMDSICVVTRTGDLDVTRAHGGLIYDTMEEALFNFRIAVISEIEDLADPKSKLREIVGRSIEKPFGVVSGIPCIDKIGHEQASSDEVERNSTEKGIFPKPHWCVEEKTIKFLQDKIKRDALLTSSETIKESSVEYDDTEAIEFLRDKMKSKTAFTMKETIQTAISAFQHLFQTKFKASEIEVSVVDLDYWLVTAEYKDSVQALELSEIEDHLAVINEPSSLGSSWSLFSPITCVKESKKSDAEWVCTCAYCMKDGYTQVPLKELEIKEIEEHLAGMKVLGRGGSRMTIEI